MEVAVETEWEKIVETHLFEKCKDVNNDRKDVSWEKPIVGKKKYVYWFAGISVDTEGTDM